MHNRAQLVKDKAERDKGKSKPNPWKKDVDYKSMMGFRDDSPYKNQAMIDINTPTGMIDMSETGTDLIANGRYLPAYSGMHQFDPGIVRETRIAQDGIQVQEGYVPVGKYPSFRNPDGSYSNEVSMGMNVEGQEMLLPSFWDGKRHTSEETSARYRKTGEHLGKFNSVEDSERAARLREFMNNEVVPYSKREGGWLDTYQNGGIRTRLGNVVPIDSYVPWAQNGMQYNFPSELKPTADDSSAYRTYVMRYLQGRPSVLDRSHELDVSIIPDWLDANTKNQVLMEHNAYKEGERLKKLMEATKKQDGGWLDQYQDGGKPKWDWSKVPETKFVSKDDPRLKAQETKKSIKAIPKVIPKVVPKSVAPKTPVSKPAVTPTESYPADVQQYVDQAKANPKWDKSKQKYYVVSRENHRTYVFDHNHRPVGNFPVLLGKDNTPTPSGRFAFDEPWTEDRRWKEYGSPFYSFSGAYGMHGPWEEERAMRESALAKDTCRDLSHGCINAQLPYVLPGSTTAPAQGDSIFIPEKIVKPSPKQVTIASKPQPKKGSDVSADNNGKPVIHNKQVKSWYDGQPQEIKDAIKSTQYVAKKQYGGWLDHYNI
jgi:hypothetical protein